MLRSMAILDSFTFTIRPVAIFWITVTREPSEKPMSDKCCFTAGVPLMEVTVTSSPIDAKSNGID